jgi:hypothetical protein
MFNYFVLTDMQRVVLYYITDLDFWPFFFCCADS